MSSSYSTPFIFLFIFLLFFSITITSTHSARILLNVVESPPQSPQHHPTQPPSITFIMQDILPKTNIINPQQQQQQQQQLPFAKPLRTFPLTYGGIPLPHQKNPNKQNSPTQTFEIPKFGIAFATTNKDLQQEMEFGLVTTIEEEIYDENSVFGPTMTLMGVSKGVYVAMNSSSQNDNNDDDDHNSHMMAMTVTLYNDINDDIDDDDEVDGLKLFGVHRRDVMECHVAVIGGTGKFKDANGFAVIKVLSTNRLGFSDVEEELSDEKANNMMLLYNVYLS